MYRDHEYFLSEYEIQYMAILKDIYENGYADGVNERTGIATKRLPAQVIRVDVSKEFPILKSKQVYWKTANKEIDWIWKAMSNNINDLGAHIWDEWADKNGSIGKAYGYQMRRPVITMINGEVRYYPDQPHYVRDYLKEFPNGRQATATLLNPTEMKDMGLVPCVHTSNWNLDGGRLNCVLDQRSGDFPVGVPFNTTQYAMLMIQMANDLGVEPGILLHTIADAHIYDRQMEGVKIQLERYKEMQSFMNTGYNNMVIKTSHELTSMNDEERQHFRKMHITMQYVPTYCIDYGENHSMDMFAVTADQCKVCGYGKEYGNLGYIDFGDIAV